jgi:hypothetical protein
MFSPTSPNVTQTQLCNPLARRSRRTTSSIKNMGAAVIALLASANTFAQAADDRTRMAREQYACAVTMGLHQPGDLYDTCIRSLDKTLSQLDQAQWVWKNRSGCAQEGLQPGTPAFAVCVVEAERSPADAARHAAIATVR